MRRTNDIKYLYLTRFFRAGFTMVKINLDGGRPKRAPQKRGSKKRTPRYEEDLYEDDIYDDEFDEYTYYDDDDIDEDDDDGYYYDDEEDDEEDYDDVPKSERFASKWDKVKKPLIIFGVFVILAIGIRMFTHKDKPEEKKQDEPKQEQVEKKSEEPVTTEQKKEQEISASKGLGREEEAAKNTLEKPDVIGTNADKEAVTKRLKASAEKVKEEKDKFKNDQDGGLSLTGYSMLSNFRTALESSYEVDYDSVNVYKAKADNVIQFTFKMTNKDGKILVFAGNYLPATDQMEIAVMKGDLIPVKSSEASSPTKDPQVDNEKAKENSDKPKNPEKIKDA